MNQFHINPAIYVLAGSTWLRLRLHRLHLCLDASAFSAAACLTAEPRSGSAPPPQWLCASACLAASPALALSMSVARRERTISGSREGWTYLPLAFFRSVSKTLFLGVTQPMQVLIKLVKKPFSPGVSYVRQDTDASG
jgi:drug/metabolite transporter (DMT)-like permease